MTLFGRNKQQQAKDSQDGDGSSSADGGGGEPRLKVIVPAISKASKKPLSLDDVGSSSGSLSITSNGRVRTPIAGHGRLSSGIRSSASQNNHLHPNNGVGGGYNSPLHATASSPLTPSQGRYASVSRHGLRESVLAASLHHGSNGRYQKSLNNNNNGVGGMYSLANNYDEEEENGTLESPLSMLSSSAARVHTDVVIETGDKTVRIQDWTDDFETYGREVDPLALAVSAINGNSSAPLTRHKAQQVSEV